MKHLIFLLFLITAATSRGEDSYWDVNLVRSYVHHSELQRRWAWSFAIPYLKTLKGDERILDIGCGDGKITADVSKFVPLGQITGIDPSEAMLHWAKRQFHPIEYPNLHFQKGGFLEPNLSLQFDLILTFCALQHCQDLHSACENIASLLSPSGKVLILVPAMNHAAWNQARSNTMSSSRWMPYWKNSRPRQFLSALQYRELLETTSLEPIKIETIQTMDPFVDKHELLTWLQGTFPSCVPASFSAEFYNEWIDEYIRLDPEALDANGAIYVKFSLIAIEAIGKKNG